MKPFKRLTDWVSDKLRPGIDVTQDEIEERQAFVDRIERERERRAQARVTSKDEEDAP